MNKTNTKYGNEKQKNRQWVFNIASKLIDKNKSIKTLSFPAEGGLKGLKDGSSFEGLVANHFTNAKLIGIESNKKYYNQLVKRFKSELNKIDLIRATSTVHLKERNEYDLVWLDYFGGTDSKTIVSLRDAFQNGAFSNDCLLFVTLCKEHRGIVYGTPQFLFSLSKTGTLENGHYHLVKKLGAEFGYTVKMVKKFEYKNNSVSSHSKPMVTIAYKITK